MAAATATMLLPAAFPAFRTAPRQIRNVTGDAHQPVARGNGALNSWRSSGRRKYAC
jgi:hypothetical protein